MNDCSYRFAASEPAGITCFPSRAATDRRFPRSSQHEVLSAVLPALFGAWSTSTSFGTPPAVPMPSR